MATSFARSPRALVIKIYAVVIFLFAFVFAPFMWYQISQRLKSFFVLDDAPSPLMFGLYLSVFRKYLPELAAVTVMAGIILILLNKRR